MGKKKKIMSTSPPYQDLQNSNRTVDEHCWIIHIRRSLDEDLDQEPDTPVLIFNVPKSLLLTSPESYIPQQIALGPYHHHRAELHEMERYKLASAKRLQKRANGLRFHDLVDRFIVYEPKLRSFYQKYLNFNGEMLAWMMAMDSCFLLEFLQAFTAEDKKLIDITGWRSGHDAFVRDIFMLENQLPLPLLRKTAEFQSLSEDALGSILTGFCHAVSPFKTMKPRPQHDLEKCAHLLDFMYNSIVPKMEGSVEIEEQDVDDRENIQGNIGLISKLIMSIIALPLKVISNLPGVIVLRQFKRLLFPIEVENRDRCEDKRALEEEIVIPSASQLSTAGIKFAPCETGVEGVWFDASMATLHMPSVRLDMNTTVVLRNMVAYEACGAWGPLVLARYTELMNGIVDGPDDVRVLRESRVVVSHLRCDRDVADLWNGMSRSVRMTKVPFLDRAIEEVKEYYEGRWRVKIDRFLGRHVFGSWRYMVLVGAVWVLFFVGMQGLGSVFGLYNRKRVN